MPPTTIATHSGPFHADDVMAVALLRTFVAADAVVVRTRDLARIAACDFAVDVGGEFDPARLRFDHHQAAYPGALSSAGMVLAWLRDTGRIPAAFAEELRLGAVDYLDAVDTGRTAPDPAVPCFPRLIDALVQPAEDEPAFDAQFAVGVQIALAWIAGLRAGFDKRSAAVAAVTAAVAVADAAGSNVLRFDRYIHWKPAYFAAGGASHPSEFVLFPGTDGTWRVVAIPPSEHDFGQKRSLPEAWAGLTDDALAAVTGVPGSVFCHKNRFIAVFRTEEGALEALSRFGLRRGR